MTTVYWNDWYTGWGWVLWFGMLMLIFSSVGTWGYSYTSNRRYRDFDPGRDAFDMLAERYAKGEIQRDEYKRMHNEILTMDRGSSKGIKSKSRPLAPTTQAT